MTDGTAKVQALAREQLTGLAADDTLEWLWTKSALESLAAGRIIIPETGDIRRLTTLNQVWKGVAAWPREDGWYRIAAVFRAHRLAIVRNDRDWLDELERCWRALPLEAFASQLRAQMEIGLGMAAGGDSPVCFSNENIDVLIQNEVIRTDLDSDQTWIALVRGDLAAARHGLTAYGKRIVSFQAELTATPEKGVRESLGKADLVLQIEYRALHALVQRAKNP